MNRIAHKAGNALLFASMTCLAACLSPATEAKVQAAIATNKTKITNYCQSDIIPISSNPLVAAGVTALSDLSPIAAGAAAALAATCDPKNIDAVSASASTLAFLAANKVNVTSNGKVVAPVIAPVPIVTGNEPLPAVVVAK